MIRAAIFDLDGLMVDSEPLGLQAWQRCLKPAGVSLTDAQYRHLIGMGHAESVQYVLEQTGAALTFAALDRGFWEHFLEVIAENELGPAAGLLPLLDDLRARGFALGVASNSPTAYVRSVIERIGVSERFEAVVGADEVQHAKPAPDVYLEVARRLGVAPSRCLAFEDSLSGRQAAQAAGMPCVLVPNPDLHLTPDLAGGARVAASLKACHTALDEILAWAADRHSFL
jgi:HAD superfamily hydrolase (TIGR01509 family)